MTTRGAKMQAKILSALRQQSEPQSAYALLRLLRVERPRLAPPSVYRALATLTEQGLVHRLESMKAYVACQRGDHPDGCILAICDECGAVEEHVSRSLIDDVSAETGKSGFAATRHVIEIHGCCGSCRPSGAEQ